MKRSIEKLFRQQKEIAEKIKKEQEKCPHENYNNKYGASTGHFDPNDDYYWIDYTCLDCGKRWSTSQ